jgi:signal transduction histidine kinase
MQTAPETPTALPAHTPLDAAVETIARVATIDSILAVCLKVTGMGYGVVAHVTDDRWLACAVLDQIAFGLPVGGELPIQSTLCNEVRLKRTSIAFDHASTDPRWRDHHTPQTYGLESYIAVPITLADGEVFGTLCAIDAKPAPASQPETVAMFELFAQLIATQIDAQKRALLSEAALLDERMTAELREEFIAVLGHDLRNPLAAIEAGMTLLEKKPLNDASKRIVHEVKRSTGRMGRLINDVLDFARGRLGSGITAAQRPVDLAPVLFQVVGEMRAIHSNRDIVVEMQLDGPVDCDPDRIAQLASNLLANAIAHGDPTAPVRLDATTTEDAFVLSVTNAGAPISPSVQARLFQPFSRRHTGDAQDGLGLGLYIASQIAQAHAGDLAALSTDAETRFELRIPRTPALN